MGARENEKKHGIEIEGCMRGKRRKTRMNFPESVKQKIIVTVGINSEKSLQRSDCQTLINWDLWVLCGLNNSAKGLCTNE